jgi:hypothetical protein
MTKERAREQGRAVPKLQRKRASWQQVLRTVRDRAPIRMPVLRKRQSGTKQVLLRMRDQPWSRHVAASCADSEINDVRGRASPAHRHVL